MTLAVVKIGGSYAHSPRLAEIAAALARGAGRAVVVPGGGPFADCVRAEQGRIGYDDQAAHRMALLAMAQFGLALVSLSPQIATAGDPSKSLPPGEGRLGESRAGAKAAWMRDALVPTPSLRDIPILVGSGSTPVWLPLDLLGGDPEVAECWDMTSDSLAAWLAGRLAASRLIFVKSAEALHSTEAAHLAAEGVLDPLAPTYLAKIAAHAWLCGPSRLAHLGEALARGAPCGQRILTG